MEASGYLKELTASKDPQDEVRVENIAELENVTREYEEQFAEDNDTDEVATLSNFLERVSLVADSDQIPTGEEHGGVVTLMTLHTAKGLDAFRPKPLQVLIHQWAQVEGPQEDNGLVSA